MAADTEGRCIARQKLCCPTGDRAGNGQLLLLLLQASPPYSLRRLSRTVGARWLSDVPVWGVRDDGVALLAMWEPLPAMPITAAGPSALCGLEARLPLMVLPVPLRAARQ